MCTLTLCSYGGIFELGTREYTLDDFYALQLDKLERFVCLKPSGIVIPTEAEESSEEGDSGDDGSDDDEDEEDAERESESEDEREKKRKGEGKEKKGKRRDVEESDEEPERPTSDVDATAGTETQGAEIGKQVRQQPVAHCSPGSRGDARTTYGPKRQRSWASQQRMRPVRPKMLSVRLPQERRSPCFTPALVRLIWMFCRRPRLTWTQANTGPKKLTKNMPTTTAASNYDATASGSPKRGMVSPFGGTGGHLTFTLTSRV